MRRIPILVAVTAFAAAGLVGCSSPSASASCDRPSASPTASVTFGLIDVSGQAEAAPDIDVRTPFHVRSTSSYDLEVGDGAAITTDSQLVALDLSLVSGETGQPLVSTAYNGDTSRALPLTQWAETFPELVDVLDCATEGSRIVVALSPEGIASEAAEGLGLADGESAIAVIDLRKVYLPRADGADQYSDARGLPTVVRAPDGRPGVIVPEAEAPTESVTQVLKKGDGAEVNDEDTVLFEFTSVEWDDPRSTVETTWGAEPVRQTLDALPPVVADALRGQPAGSQVLIVQPAEEADAQSTPALVYVIDVLGVG